MGLGCLMQAYTSQFVALIMFALMMSEDRLSLQKRRLEIIDGLRILPGQSREIIGKHKAVCVLLEFVHLCLSQFLKPSPPSESFCFTRADSSCAGAG